MTPPLRRAHRIIWLLLAVMLPLGFVAALLAYRSPLQQEPVIQPQAAPLPIILRSVSTDNLVINLRRSAQGAEQQLEITLKPPFEVPSAVVGIRQNGNWQTVGLLNAPGIYRFPVHLTDAHLQVRIVDNLRRKTLQTLAL